MTEFPPTDAADAPAALSAFLRGIERRGAVFAELLAGDPLLAEQAYAVALRQFRDHAQAQPFGYWPRLFWRSLLASPKLRAGAPAPRWAPAFSGLGKAGSGPRAALLLRLVAGLTDADAAAALGVAQPTYRLALQRALPHRTDGSADPDAWRALGEAVQQAIHGLPAERLAHLARLRQAAVQGRRPELIGPLYMSEPAEASAPAARWPHPWLRAALWTGLAGCALALAATFVWPLVGAFGDAGDPEIRTRPLGPARAPVARYDAASGLLTERDFELLAAGPLRPPADDPGFFAWYAAELAKGADPDRGAGMRAPRPQASTPGQAPESIDAP